MPGSKLKKTYISALVVQAAEASGHKKAGVKNPWHKNAGGRKSQGRKTLGTKWSLKKLYGLGIQSSGHSSVETEIVDV